MRDFVNIAGGPIEQHFQARVVYLDLLMSLEITAEEWFRIELLGVFSRLTGISIKGTNRQIQNTKDRPDFALDLAGRALLVELKVLPRGRNAPYGWQRFQETPNNKKDFENLVAGARHGVLYVYWNDLTDWVNCRKNIEEVYDVVCLREDRIPCNNGHTIFSYWAR